MTHDELEWEREESKKRREAREAAGEKLRGRTPRVSGSKYHEFVVGEKGRRRDEEHYVTPRVR